MDLHFVFEDLADRRGGLSRALKWRCIDGSDALDFRQTFGNTVGFCHAAFGQMQTLCATRQYLAGGGGAAMSNHQDQCWFGAF